MDSVIEIVEHSIDANGVFEVRVRYPGKGAAYPVTVTDSATPADEQLLGWYFEQHLRYPFLDGDRRRTAVTMLREYGQKLFAQVFGGEAGFEYQVMRGRGFDDCRIEVVGGAGLHRLHWEALFDPELDSPLAVRVPITRRVELRPARFEIAGPRPSLNILIVTARPDGAQDVGYRTISRPLVAAVRQAELPVQVDMVRPGTWAALRAHLDAAREKYGSGWYQLVHFDLHGAFTDHTTIQTGSRTGRYLFASGEPQRSRARKASCFSKPAPSAPPTLARPRKWRTCWPSTGCRWRYSTPASQRCKPPARPHWPSNWSQPGSRWWSAWRTR